MFSFSLCFPNLLIFLYSNCSFSFFLIFLLLPSPAPFLNTAVLQGSFLTRILCPHSLGDFNASHAFSYHLWVKTIKFIYNSSSGFIPKLQISISSCLLNIYFHLNVPHPSNSTFHLSNISLISVFPNPHLFQSSQTRNLEVT